MAFKNTHTAGGGGVPRRGRSELTRQQRKGGRAGAWASPGSRPGISRAARHPPKEPRGGVFSLCPPRDEGPLTGIQFNEERENFESFNYTQGYKK